MSRPAYERTDLTIHEISFVKKGAAGNGKLKPKVLFWKGQKPVANLLDMLKRTFSKTDQKPEAKLAADALEVLNGNAEFRKILEKMEKAVGSGDGPRTPEMMLQDLMAQLNPEQQDVLSLILAAAKASPPPALEPAAPAPDASMDDSAKMDDEAMKKLAKSHPCVYAELKKAQDEAKAAREESNALASKVDEMAKSADHTRYLDQVRELTFLPGDASEVADLLQAAEVLPDTHKETLSKLLKTTAGIVEKSDMFKGEKGTTRRSEDNGDGSSAESRIDAAAKRMQDEFRKSNNGKSKLSYSQAYRKVLKERPDLRKALNEERAGR